MYHCLINKTFVWLYFVKSVSLSLKTFLMVINGRLPHKVAENCHRNLILPNLFLQGLKQDLLGQQPQNSISSEESS